MFKNLIRFRLLDFFELTAAVAGALYAYRSVDWYPTERIWVIAAAAIAAITIWFATRLGKSARAPGLFLSAYGGALYGLCDFSLWVVIFGRLKVTSAASAIFPNVEKVTWQERLTIVIVIAALMVIPAICCACTWLALGAGWRIARKEWKTPESLIGRASVVAQLLIAASFITGIGYYALRPQIRHAGTIRIPIVYKPFSNSPEDLYGPEVSDWTISPSGDLLVLFSDMRLQRFDLRTHRLIESRKINSKPSEQFRMRRQGADHCFHDYGEDFKLEEIQIWQFDSQKLFVNRPSTGIEVHDLSTKELSSNDLEQPPTFFAKGESIKAISASGKYVVTERLSPNRSPTTQLATYDTQAGKCICEFERDTKALDYEYVIVDDCDGKVGFLRLSLGCGNWALYRGQFGTSGTPIVSEGRSQDQRLKLTNSGLKQAASDQNLLESFWKEAITVIMEPNTNRVLMIGEEISSALRPQYEFEAPRLPILEHLLQVAINGQPTLFETSDRSYTTSWLRKNLKVDWRAKRPKFTPDGRYFIIQDEDEHETADLFHVFAMP